MCALTHGRGYRARDGLVVTLTGSKLLPRLRQPYVGSWKLDPQQHSLQKRRGSKDPCSAICAATALRHSLMDQIIYCTFAPVIDLKAEPQDCTFRGLDRRLHSHLLSTMHADDEVTAHASLVVLCIANPKIRHVLCYVKRIYICAAFPGICLMHALLSSIITHVLTDVLCCYCCTQSACHYDWKGSSQGPDLR